ncbi:MAG: HTH domain-containing protein, partial [Atopostipes sp.]|nr:HTH domain-containing protein [Atopostipes sp.]
MNNRQLEILQILSENSGKNITSKLLSVETTVSTRTIKSDIKTINEQYPQLIQSSNKGYRIDKKDLTKYSLAINENALPQSPIERIRYIINYLLTDDTNYSSSDFSEFLYVSNSTIQNDLELIK